MLDQITEIQKLKLHEGECLIVKYPMGNLPHKLWQRSADDLRQALATCLLSNNVLVIGADIDFTVIEKENTERDYTEHF